MGTQAGLDFCTKLAKLNRGKLDQKYPIFLLYNKSNIPDRKTNLKRYKYVLKVWSKVVNFLKKIIANLYLYHVILLIIGYMILRKRLKFQY